MTKLAAVRVTCLPVGRAAAGVRFLFPALFLALFLALAACGSGGGGGSQPQAGTSVTITSRTPAPDTVSPTVPMVLQVEFDAALVAGQILDDAIRVTQQGSGVPIAGTIAIANPGPDERLEFMPNPGVAGLRAGVAYTVTLSTDLRFEGGRTLPATEWRFSIAPGAAIAMSNYYQFPITVDDVLERPVHVGDGGLGMAIDLGSNVVNATFWNATTRQWSTPVAMRPKQTLDQTILGDGEGGFLFQHRSFPNLTQVEIQRVRPEGLQGTQLLNTMYPVLLRTIGGGFTCWSYAATANQPACFVLAPGASAWTPVVAVASYGLGVTTLGNGDRVTGVTPATGGAVHSMRVVRPAGSATAQVVIERRAANGALLQVTTRDTGIAAGDGAVREVYDASGKVVAGIELLDSGLSGNRLWIGAIEHDPATGWGQFQALRPTNTSVLAGHIKMLRDGDRTAIYFISASGVYECLSKVDGGDWQYEATPLLANGFAGAEFAIDAAGNACMIEVSGIGGLFDLKVAKAPAGESWSSLVSGRERGVVPSSAVSATACSIHPIGNGKFLVVANYTVFGASSILASFEVE